MDMLLVKKLPGLYGKKYWYVVTMSGKKVAGGWDQVDRATEELAAIRAEQKQAVRRA